MKLFKLNCHFGTIYLVKVYMFTTNIGIIQLASKLDRCNLLKIISFWKTILQK